MGKIENHPTWKCDRCGTEKTSKSKPNTPSDPWGYVKVDQDAAFDYHGCPWAPRMRDKMLLCGGCVEKVMDVLKNKPEPPEGE